MNERQIRHFLRFEGINAAILSVVVGAVISYFLRYHAEYSKTVDYHFPGTIPTLVRFVLFQAVPTGAIVLLQIEPFRCNFPTKFRWRDLCTVGVIIINLAYCFIFNGYIAVYGGDAEFLSDWFRFGYAILLLIFPVLLRFGFQLSTPATLIKDDIRYQNFLKFSPFGYSVGVTVAFIAIMWFLFHFPLWSIPVTYISIVVCLYCYYHDYKKCTLAPAASHIQSVRSLHKVGTGLCDLSDWPHSLRPNFHYALTYGICAIIPVVLAQLYIRTACVSFTKGFGRCISYDLSDVKTSSSHILWKLMFRLWTSIFSFIMEGISVFAFSDYHFLHRSYYWRFIEDLTVCVALVTENDVSLLLTHLGLNFVFVVLKDGGAVDDIIWSLISKRWIYSKLSSDSAEDFTISLKLIQEVRSQIIRSKLNFVSRISSISCIGTIALLDKTLFTHGEPIWQMAELTNIVLAVSVVLVQVTASRQLNRLIFARKELFMKDITSIFRINVDVLRDQLYSPNYNSQDVVTGWRLYLSLVSLLAVFVVFIDLHHLPT